MDAAGQNSMPLMGRRYRNTNFHSSNIKHIGFLDGPDQRHFPPRRIKRLIDSACWLEDIIPVVKYCLATGA
jgi:hypothetical protein